MWDLDEENKTIRSQFLNADNEQLSSSTSTYKEQPE